MCALFSVKNGKFHKPFAAISRDQAWQPTLAACGVTVTPVNHFASKEDADRYTGGRLAQFMCQHCNKSEEQNAL